jgi:hypothetical protein
MPAPPLVEYDLFNDTTFVKSSARVKPNQTFIVAYADLPRSPVMAAEWQQALDDAWSYIRSWYPSAFKLSEMPTRHGNISGTEMMVDPGTGKGRATMTVRTHLVGNRLYILIVHDTIGRNGPKFLDSFQPDDLGLKK